ncbi:major capsid protein [Synechococcus phage S-N03]|uniref:Major capsid protein n=1 Tax=Synechococcus phage S-N03 TaxID=2718943 RepID=A0A6G8R652_9CAUD|nr:major head protein [Synechococcus phage S-N03]QIN96853.1 major capsid protein [Synechococcus phage S-N03]
MSQHLTEKWAPVLGHQDLPEIKDSYRAAVTAQLLENQEAFLREQAAMGQGSSLLSEAVPTMSTGTNATPGAGAGNAGFGADAAAGGPVAGFDPVMIGLIRRAMPNLMAYDICGVQPMTGPTGLIFAMRALYGGQDPTNAEALFNEADISYANNETATNSQESNPGLLNDATLGGVTPGNYDPTLASGEGAGMGTETLEDATFRQMGFSIEKTIVEAKGRALKAQYSLELAQDLRAIHGLDAEAELANILSSEILAEINREVVRTIYQSAVSGAQNNVANAGVFDLDVDSNGRWSVEKFKGLLFQLERDCNAIAQQTRRGKGNLVICSADVASALTMAGVLDYTPALNANLNVDDQGNLFAGTINGKIKVYIDPYSANVSNTQYYVAGYKGTNAYDAGLFYCPYVPLQMVRSVTADSFQPNIGFKTRYGLVANPFARGYGASNGAIESNTNKYYRRVRIENLM